MIKISTRGAQRVKNSIRRAASRMRPSAHVTVGIHEEEGQHSNGISNAQLGAAHHFGTDDLPARPWLDVGVSQGTEKYSEAISGALMGGRSYEDALEAVGALAAAEAQVYLTNLDNPPNSPETQRRKGSNNPLIDSGQLRASVGHKVQKGNI